MQQKGQALVILLLVLVVAMTVGLSVVSRTITNVRESSTTERSSRAFTAAEAGIESVLSQDLAALSRSGQVSSVDLGTGTSTVTVTEAGGAEAYQPVKPVEKDDVVQVNIDTTGLANPANSLTVSWGASGASDEGLGTNCAPTSNPSPALEITVYGWDGAANYSVDRYVYNAANCGSLGLTNGLQSSQAASNGFTSRTPSGFINLASKVPKPRLMRIRPLYNKATLRIEPDAGKSLPVQSYKVRSEGVSGDTKRVVEVERSIGGLPPMFDFAMFNGTTADDPNAGATIKN